MGTSRKVPVGRGKGSSGGTSRPVSHPGVTGQGSSGSNFISPYQPPPAGPDFDGDLTLIDPNAYATVHVADHFWRVKVPGASALRAVAEMTELRGGEQIHAINTFLQAHLHPEDFRLMVRRMVDPDDSFASEHYMDLYRHAVTVGTARPFRLSLGSPKPLSTTGELFGPSWLSVAYQPR